MESTTLESFSAPTTSNPLDRVRMLERELLGVRMQNQLLVKQNLKLETQYATLR
jgi:hypothetical protein